MDYEKKYKEALAKAREIHRNENEKRSDMEWFFPELKESEDERIRKGLIKALSSIGKRNWGGIDVFESISWLEKQKSVREIVERCKNSWYNEGKIDGMAEGLTNDEKYQQGWHDALEKQCQTFTKKDVDDAYLKGIIDAKHELEKQGEQKPILDFKASNFYVSKVDGKIHDMTYNPADKVEPRFKVKYAGSEYNVLEVKDIAGVTFYGIEDEPNHIDYIKAENCEIISGYSIKENGSPYPTKPAVFSEKKPAAWSEKDENYLQSAENACEYQYGKNTSTILWLKSLKNRATWKPSKEQMDALLGIMIESGFDYIDYNTLESLYNDLKKL